jgi:transcriptional antiterminator RfaH
LIRFFALHIAAQEPRDAALLGNDGGFDPRGVREPLYSEAQTDPFMGAVAEKALAEQRVKTGAEWEIFNPRVRETKRWSRNRTREVEKPYFPGYIFIAFDVHGDDWPPINITRGIKDNGLMLSTISRPATIPSLVIEDLIGRCEVELYPERDGTITPRHYIKQEVADAYLFQVGSTVRVAEGPWAGLTGPVAWASRDRVKLIMSLFGSERPVEFRASNLELTKV